MNPVFNDCESTNTDIGKTWHVIPIDDWREHADNPDCWCRPTQDDEEPLLYIHHSLDRREEYEEGRPLS